MKEEKLQLTLQLAANKMDKLEEMLAKFDSIRNSVLTNSKFK